MAQEDPSRVAFLLIRARNDEGKHRYLLQKRADDANHGGTWGLPGGKCHVGEAPWDAACRESAEEMGDLPPMEPSATWERDDGDRTIWTFLVDLPQMFTPSLDGATPDETAGWGWFKRKHVGDLPLHPAFEETWDDIDWDEVGKSASGYTLNPRSGMISLDLPAGLLAVPPGGVTDHHVTVVYLGPDVDDQALASVCYRTAQAASGCEPLAGTIGGLGAFPPSDSSDGKVPVFAKVDLPGAEALRAALEDLSASEHKDWHPHVTLGYFGPDDPLPPEPPAVAVTFADLSVHRGSDVFRFPLGEPVAKAVMTPAQYQIQQIAYESAVQLANHLGASVNAGQVAQQWLNRYAHKRKPRRSKANRKPRQRPAPRRYLNTAGATAAISAALTAVLVELWAAAWIAGVSVAAFLLGLGALGVYDDALALLEAEGKRRVEDMVQTRASRLERVLMEALSEGWDADRLAEEIQSVLGSQASALLVTVTEAQWASQQALLRAFQQAGVTHVRWNTRRDGKVCQRCLTAQAAGPWPIGKPFPGANVPAPGAHPRCRCWLTVAAAPKTAKSAETPIVSTVHHPLGHEGLWHTPDRHVATMQQLPAYVQNTARAIAREHGGTPEAAIPMAIAAVKAWAAGHAFGGKVKVTAEVQQAAQAALDEWEQLKASHH